MRNVATLLLVMAALCVAGCSFLKERGDPTVTNIPPPVVVDPPDRENEVSPALEKYTALLEKHNRTIAEMARQQEQNRQLYDESRKVNEQAITLKGELARTQKELQEANDLLIEVRQQNEKWKADVLGYRDEIRTALQTILETEIRVVRLLGGEAPEQNAVPEAKAPGAKTPAPATPTKASASLPRPSGTPARTAAPSNSGSTATAAKESQSSTQAPAPDKGKAPTQTEGAKGAKTNPAG